MKQAIAGVAPPELSEVTVMEVLPSLARYALGRFHGRCYSIRWPNLYIFRLGNLLALLSIPGALALYFFRLLPAPGFLKKKPPFHGVSYKLTNRRLLELRPELQFMRGFPFFKLAFVENRSLDLDRFDKITIERRSGQEWYDAGDLVFFKNNVETFRLPGVSRPEAFRQTCMKSQMARAGVKAATRA